MRFPKIIISLLLIDQLISIDLDQIETFIRKGNKNGIQTIKTMGGKIIEEYKATMHKGASKIHTINEYELDKKNRKVIKITKSLEKGGLKLSYTTTYKYDANGNQILERVKFPKNSSDDYGEVGQFYYFERSFDAKNRLSTEKFWSTSSFEKEKFTQSGYFLKSFKSFAHKYDDQGRLIEEKSYHVNPKTQRQTLWRTQLYKYDEKSQVTEIVISADPYHLHKSVKNFIPPKSYIRFQYDASGHKISESHWDPGEKLRSQEVLVYAGDRLSMKAFIYEVGKVSSVDVYLYDLNGFTQIIETYEE